MAFNPVNQQTTLIERLRAFERKERLAVLKESLGLKDDVKIPLSECFRKNIRKLIQVEVPEKVFLAMDYHLDWIEIATYLSKPENSEIGEHFKYHNFDKINQNQQDIDLLVAFEDDQHKTSVTHLVMIEAKAFSAWDTEQLKSKTERLKEIYDLNMINRKDLCPHFLLMSQSEPQKISGKGWQDWMLGPNGKPQWLPYHLPRRQKITRCDNKRRNDKGGGHLKLHWTRRA